MPREAPTAPPRPAEDLALLERARGGDRVAQAKLYADAWPDACRTFARVWRLPVDHHDVRAAADDVFVDLCDIDPAGRTGWERYQPPPGGLPFRGFVRMVATRKALNAVRDRRARAEKRAGRMPLARATGLAERLEAREEVRLVMARLEPAQARALRLVDVDGVRIAEAARALGLRSYSAANSLLGRARARARALRAALASG